MFVGVLPAIFFSSHGKIFWRMRKDSTFTPEESRLPRRRRGLVQQPFAAMGADVVKSRAVLLSAFVLG